ncbi:MAG: CHASE domain-containing protein [Alcanivorax sp.]
MIQKALSMTAIMLGLIVMIGWYLRLDVLIQVHPHFAPMQFNTALGFFICGLGLLSITYNKQKTGLVLGALISTLSLTTIIQYIFNVDLGIDAIFNDPYILTRTSHPGRMAPNTAFCFSLCGFALILAQMKRSIMFTLGITILFIALLSLCGYLIQAEDLYGWGNLTRMAIHTSLGFVFLGSALLLQSLSKNSDLHANLWDLVPQAATTVFCVMTLLAFSAFTEQTRKHNESYFETLVIETHEAIKQRYALYEESLISGLGLYYASESVERHEWEKYVVTLNIDRTMPGINGIGYIDYVKNTHLPEYLKTVRADNAPDFTNHPETAFNDKFIIKYIEPVSANKEAVGLDIGFEKNRREAAERARDSGTTTITKKILLVQDNQKQAGFLYLIPVYKTKMTPETVKERRQQLQGWVYAPFIGSNFFKDINSFNNHQLDFTVYDGDDITNQDIIYTSGQKTVHGKNKNILNMRTVLNFAGSEWTILWCANNAYTPPAGMILSYALLILGLCFSVALFFILDNLIHKNSEITRRVEEQTARLKEASEFRRIIGNTIPDYLFVKDEEFRIVEANDTFLTLYPDKTREEIIGRTMLEGHDKKEAEEFLENDKKAFKKGYSGVEETIKFPDGTTRTLFTKKVRFQNASGQPFILGIAQDITAAKKAKEQILKTNKELERSNIELQRFAQIASHDLQEPLRKITSFINELEEHLEDQLDEDARFYMKFIRGGADQMHNLVKGLLQYSTVNKNKPDIQKIDTNEVIKIAIDNLSESIKETGAEITYDTLPTVYYDRVMLTQIFQNLIGNAIKYKSEKTPKITISAEKLADCWEFSVDDNGMGMEEKYLDRIFDMFQRLHRKEDIPGTGIGLSLCQKIVERYGGIIWVESEPEKGSTFIFTIPTKKKYVVSAASGYLGEGI